MQFPNVFREILTVFGRQSGELFEGSDLAKIGAFDVFRADADELLRDSGVDDSLNANATVFLFHQGYTFLYFLASGGLDAPVFQFTEGKLGFEKVANGLVELLNNELGMMEENHRNLHSTGGYWVHIENGTPTVTYPARSSGERPLDGPDLFLD